jgi:hypothetical protein
MELKEYKINRSERGEIALCIIKEGLSLLEYPKINDCSIINMFEIQYTHKLKCYPTLRFSLMDRESPSILLDARKSYFSIHNCY